MRNAPGRGLRGQSPTGWISALARHIGKPVLQLDQLLLTPSDQCRGLLLPVVETRPALTADLAGCVLGELLPTLFDDADARGHLLPRVRTLDEDVQAELDTVYADIGVTRGCRDDVGLARGGDAVPLLELNRNGQDVLLDFHGYVLHFYAPCVRVGTGTTLN